MKALSSLQNSLGVYAETFRYVQRSKVPEQNITQLKYQWAKSILSKLRVHLEVVNKPTEEKSILFLGNHISYLDIPVLLSTCPRLSFIAKNELSRWPIFGEAAKKIETVFVNRGNGNSRQAARQSIHEALQNGKRLVVFPSGTTCVSENKAWKKGSFEIAQIEKIKIQPFRISYQPLRAVAYIDHDFFPFHLYQLFSHEEIKARIEFHASVHVENPTLDCLRWHNWTREISAPQRNLPL